VVAAEFNFDDNSFFGNTTFSYTITFTDSTSQTGSVNANGPANVRTLAGTGGNTGKEIAHIAISITGGTDGDVTLQSVTQAQVTSPGILPDADVNKLLFISDGVPNRALTDDSTYMSNDTPLIIASEALQHVLGTGAGDTVSEIATIEGTHGFTIEAVGINVNGTALGILDQVEGAGGDADNVTTAEQLNDLIDPLNSTPIGSAVGEDVINGGAGNDIIFGDVPNTDTLAGTESVPLPAGSGWSVFEYLEDNTAWTRDDTIAYLRDPANLADLAAGDRGEADMIDGGAGDDIIVGQGGDDTLTGGTGADTFVYSLTANQGMDAIADFTLSDGDVLSFTDVVDIGGPAGIDTADVIASYVDGGAPGAVDTVTLVSGTVINIVDVDNAFTNANDVFNNSLING
jgi:Ca2+-binding RTX toxin-like protein